MVWPNKSSTGEVPAKDLSINDFVVEDTVANAEDLLGWQVSVARKERRLGNVVKAPKKRKRKLSTHFPQGFSYGAISLRF